MTLYKVINFDFFSRNLYKKMTDRLNKKRKDVMGYYPKTSMG